MIRSLTMTAIATAMAVSFAGSPAAAQNNTVGGALLGGAAGAVIGGAATGKAGGAVAGGIIGAAAGAMIGSQFEHRHSHYYWYQGRCWRRYPNGEYHRVSRRYCG
ncbi:MAG: glycine zipper domain-containing protein [Pseudolabrys sp.]